MNIKEYISSGIVESYVLGMASPEEQAAFEKNCALYPEVKAAREEFELLLEKQALENAIAPPPALKQNIFNRLTAHDDKVTGMNTPAPRRTMNLLRLTAAACVILLAGSIIWNLSLQQQNRKLVDRLNESSSKLAQVEQDLKILQDNPSVKMVNMGGTDTSPHSFATVYWDTTSHDVYLMVNNLPKPASDQQYQLWALLDGQPHDMGLLEISEKPLQLYRMKNVQAAQAFAITLEKKGRKNIAAPEGSIYVMGKL